MLLTRWLRPVPWHLVAIGGVTCDWLWIEENNRSGARMDGSKTFVIDDVWLAPIVARRYALQFRHLLVPCPLITKMSPIVCYVLCCRTHFFAFAPIVRLLSCGCSGRLLASWFFIWSAAEDPSTWHIQFRATQFERRSNSVAGVAFGGAILYVSFCWFMTKLVMNFYIYGYLYATASRFFVIALCGSLLLWFRWRMWTQRSRLRIGR